MHPLFRFAFVVVVCLMLVGLASPALAQCPGGVCRVAPIRVAASAPIRVASVPVRATKGLLGRTRFFDGDGRPLFRARQ
jgi:hypothetical protein